ncbi:MAG TPA: LPS export ABC transporter permease LptF [Chromatiaceae bacterium]|nr:LPS export ABC transporter permease LptF [Chromatiaceae bacterium]
MTQLGILDRYIASEVLKAFIAIVAILLLILVGNRFVSYLALAASGSISGVAVFELMGLKLIRNLALVIAPGFFLAVLFALGRLYKDMEAAAMAACGHGMPDHYRGVMLVAIPVSIAAMILSMLVMPWAEDMEWQVLNSEQQEAERSLFPEGQFTERRNGQLIIYVDSLSDDQHRMQDIFAWQFDRVTPTVLVAANGYTELDRHSGIHYLVLNDGRRYDGQAGKGDYQIMSFDQYRVLLEDTHQARRPRGRDEASTWTLLQSNNVADKAALHWRVSIPVSVLVLALLSVPFSRVSPRVSRYGTMILAVLSYFLYANLLTIAQSWVESGQVSVGLGLWWVHALAALMALFMLIRQCGLVWLLKGRAL